MAVKSLDELLAGLSGPEKTLLEKTLKENPDLKDGWMRQDDYSRNLTVLDSRKKEYDDAVAYNTKMEAWADENVPKWGKLKEAGLIDADGNEVWSAAKADLERQLSEARTAAVAGEDMDPKVLKANIEAILKEVGPISKEEMQALVTAEAKKLTSETFDAKYAEKETNFNEKTIPFVWGGAAAMASSVNRYEKETGKEFTDDDTKALFAMMTEKKNYDARAVMTEYIKPHKSAKDNEALIEAEVQKRLDEKLKSRGGLPGEGGEPYIPQSGEKGNIHKMLERTAPTDFESMVAAAAVKGATELNAEGKV